VTIRRTRSVVDGDDGRRRVAEGLPKSERSRRTLPLDPGVVKSLRALRTRQASERLAAGSAYQAARPGCRNTHLVVDELGEPIHPESYSDRFEVLVRQAGLPVIRLHDTRHTAATLLHLRGVPARIISEWMGHASPSFTVSVYTHSQDQALNDAGSTLATMYGVSSQLHSEPRSEKL